jgi:DNA polymerase-3 subunit delta'
MWSTIIGHSRQAEQIKRALALNRLPHAYLFSGPKGVGKRRVADAVAATIACQKPRTPDLEPCGSCPGCRKAASHNHPDLMVVESQGDNIKINQIRQLQADLKFHTMEAAAKLAIIDEAHRMTESAANSLLKILEEPSADTHFILVSSLPHRLPATIRSRCQHISFSPLPEEEISKFISTRNDMPPTKATRIARLAGGSLGTALMLDPEFIDEVTGRFMVLARGASSSDVIEAAQDWARQEPERMILIFDLMASWYRDVLFYQTTGNAGRLAHPQAADAASHIESSRVMHNLSEIAKARAAADGNANKQLMFEHLLFTLVDQKPD